MKKLLKLLFNRWIFALLGLLAISLLIWFVGPLIALADSRPLESSAVRIILIVFIISFYFGKFAWGFIKARNLNTKIIEGLLRQSPSQTAPNDSAGAEEVAILHKRFEEAVAVLKQADPRDQIKRPLLASLIRRQYLYELPWYIFIGAPGSGKTTALVNSGLQFPLADRFGQETIRGIGGTRNCDWWFTNEAVLLDTAGRYTTQESDQDADSAAWTGFLKLLKKYRPRRPINGVIVTVSVDDLLQQTPAQRETQANALRKRIQELHAELNIRFPLYVLITKVDLLAGFMEFFSEYGKEERAQVWGTSFDLSEKQESLPLANFNAEFSALEQRLNDRLIDHLQQERDIQRRSLIYTFPQQFSSLKEVLGIFLNQIFSPSRFEKQPLLRGIYFTSGTQEGNPIDRVMGNLARALHLDRKLIGPNKPSGKSFFLTRLIKDVILTESELAGTNLRWERNQASLQWGAYFVAGLITISVAIAWTISYSSNKVYVSEVEAETAAVSKQVDELPAMQRLDIASLLPVLKSVRELTKTSAINNDEIPLSMGFGLYQGEKLSSASNNTYQRLLQDAFLPQLVFHIEHLLSSADQGNLKLLYGGLKAYLMLHDAKHLDRTYLKDFIITDWGNTLQREVSNEQRQALDLHLENLLNYGQLSSPIPINTQLITNVRNIVATTPIAHRIYNRLKQQGVSADIPEFTIIKAVGPTASLLFARASGQPLTKGVPGLFSYDGYYKSFFQTSKEVTKQLADEEIWVLNLQEKDFGKLFNPQAEAHLFDEVHRLYLDDYAQTWDAFINDIKLVRTNTLQGSIQSARLLSAPDSPLPILLHAIVKEVTLVNIDEADKSVVEKTTDKVKKASEKLRQLLGQTGEKISTVAILSRPENIVDDRFKELRSMVYAATPGQPAPIDIILTQINDLYLLLTTAEVALRSGATPPPSEVPTKIIADAARMPEPIRSLLTTLSTSSVSQVLGENLKNLNQSLKATVTEFCQKATSGRYPFTKESERNVTQDDFSRLFAPDGLIDKFFQNNLSQYVDTSTRPWSFREIGNASMDISSGGLQEFYRAQIVRDVFFRSGGHVAGIDFTFRPIDMDPSITQFILDIDGQLVKYSHGPQVPISVQWPGPKGSSQVRLQISKTGTGGTPGPTFEGPWALFRMLDRFQIIPSAQPEKFNVTFNIDGQKAQFEVITNSVQNPFLLGELEQFNCPTKL